MGALDDIRKRAEDALAQVDPAEPHGCDELHPLARDVLALLAVVDALPTCDAEPKRGCPAAEGRHINVATKRAQFPGICIYCDDHAPTGSVDLPYATALRALLGASR